MRLHEATLCLQLLGAVEFLQSKEELCSPVTPYHMEQCAALPPPAAEERGTGRDRRDKQELAPPYLINHALYWASTNSLRP